LEVQGTEDTILGLALANCHVGLSRLLLLNLITHANKVIRPEALTKTG
jgi:hypothetical protein